MYQRYKVVLIFSILLFFCNCKLQDDDTIKFKNYLQNSFNLDMNNNVSEYILVSGNSCKSCADYVFNNATNNPSSNKIYIFPKKYQHYKTGIVENVLIDTNNKINKLKFHQGSICKIYLKNRKIDSIVIFDLNNIESIIK